MAGCPCQSDEFTCDCINQNTCTPRDGCLATENIEGGFILCPNERIPNGKYGIIYLHRLNSVSECDERGLRKCDSSTCHAVNKSVCNDNQCYSPRHVICTSQCASNESCSVFQCDDNGLILLSQFCDEIVDCKDGSDEFRNKPGFKCNDCVLPQNNLYDDLAQCADKSDVCLGVKNACFQCFDGLLFILPNQVCDAKIDCYDLSDECLCERYFDSQVCKSAFERNSFQCFDNEHINLWNNSLSTSKTSFTKCATKFNSSISAILCDQRPECKDYSDECNCTNPPSFCHDACRLYFPMGDRYCNGVEDPAWQFINKPECPKGFDELDCPMRFKCKAKEKISIDVLQRCDGIKDCDDHSDEKDCADTSLVFSSSTEMIAEPAIKAAFWIIGFGVIFGNFYVIFASISTLKNKKTLQGVGFQQIIILNISIADFIMGVYLLTIAAYNESFSGHYGDVDHEWRSSLKCSIIGSLVVISSQASCFLMVVLTAFRLTNVVKAIESLNQSLRRWIICTVAAWVLSFIIGIVPMMSSYFMHSFSLSSSFHNGTLNLSQLTEFACRVAALSNKTIEFNGNEFQSVKEFFENDLPQNISVGIFGYFGQTSICMPRFYVAYKESSWEYTIFIISVNFLSFVFIAVGYIWIVKHCSKSSANVGRARTNQVDDQAAKMQRRIARIIATDFCCWIPICIMACVRLGFKYSDMVYQISAVLLLPINSALNPFLFTSLPDHLISWFRRVNELAQKHP